jgi:hypothetical protein
LVVRKKHWQSQWHPAQAGLKQAGEVDWSFKWQPGGWHAMLNSVRREAF